MSWQQSSLYHIYLPLVHRWYRYSGSRFQFVPLCVWTLSANYITQLLNISGTHRRYRVPPEGRIGWDGLFQRSFFYLYKFKFNVLGENLSHCWGWAKNCWENYTEVLFQGKSHHTDEMLLLWNQLCWQSCSLSCFSNISPWSGAHTWNELSSQKHVLPVQTCLPREASAVLSCRATPSPIFTQASASRCLAHVHGLILGWIACSSMSLEVLVTLRVG